jgi:Na+-driven multidrug efflux pump
MEYILVSIFFGFITGAVGRYIAKEKNRSTSEGFWFGFLLSLFGVLIVALLPTKDVNSQQNKLGEKSNKRKLLYYDIIVFGIVLVIIYYLIKTFIL